MKYLLFRLKHWLAWLPAIWKDHDFDHAYLLRIMALKMRRMAEMHRKHGITLDRLKTAGELDICAALCDRLANEPFEYKGDSHPLLSKAKAAEWYLSGSPKQDLEYLTTMMKKHLLGWWD